jgi:HEAT repeat protein
MAPAARAEDSPVRIPWQPPGLAKAFEQAKTTRRPLFIAINAERVDGGRVEGASQLLRERVYAEARLAERAKAFVCVLLMDPIADDDGAELRTRFGVEGLIVSPQHILAHADGTLIQRKEYWEYGDVPTSVDALLGMLTRALKAHEVRLALPALGSDPASRAAWAKGAQALVRAGPDLELRRAAARELAASDHEGDFLLALHAVLLEAKDVKKDDVAVFAEVACLLARPGIETLVPGLTVLLEAKDPGLRTHAAVSLEHLGSAKALDSLAKRLGKEKDEGVRASLLRALGRCGAKDAATRKTLLYEAQAKSDRVAAGAIVGLSYREGDAEIARACERLLKGAGEGLRRTALLWVLVELNDPASGDALRGELGNTPQGVASRWLIEAAVACYEGHREERKPDLDNGIAWALRESGDAALRGGRAASTFRPKAEPPVRSE